MGDHRDRRRASGRWTRTAGATLNRHGKSDSAAEYQSGDNSLMFQAAQCDMGASVAHECSQTSGASELLRRKPRPQLDELLLEFDELIELAFENAAPPNDEWLLLLLELFREPLNDRLIEVLVEVLPRDIVPMKSIGPEASCTPEAAGVAATGVAAARPMPTSVGAVWPIAVLACPISGAACAKAPVAPVAVRVVSAEPAISDAVMRCVMVVSCFDATAFKCRSPGE